MAQQPTQPSRRARGRERPRAATAAPARGRARASQRGVGLRPRENRDLRFEAPRRSRKPLICASRPGRPRERGAASEDLRGAAARDIARARALKKSSTPSRESPAQTQQRRTRRRLHRQVRQGLRGHGLHHHRVVGLQHFHAHQGPEDDVRHARGPVDSRADEKRQPVHTPISLPRSRYSHAHITYRESYQPRRCRRSRA